jgi:hypothetical protein
LDGGVDLTIALMTSSMVKSNASALVELFILYYAARTKGTMLGAAGMASRGLVIVRANWGTQ